MFVECGVYEELSFRCFTSVPPVQNKYQKKRLNEGKKRVRNQTKNRFGKTYLMAKCNVFDRFVLDLLERKKGQDFSVSGGWNMGGKKLRYFILVHK